jgi:hypothetical protein
VPSRLETATSGPLLHPVGVTQALARVSAEVTRATRSRFWGVGVEKEAVTDVPVAVAEVLRM